MRAASHMKSIYFLAMGWALVASLSIGCDKHSDSSDSAGDGKANGEAAKAPSSDDPNAQPNLACSDDFKASYHAVQTNPIGQLRSDACARFQAKYDGHSCVVDGRQATAGSLRLICAGSDHYVLRQAQIKTLSDKPSGCLLPLITAEIEVLHAAGDLASVKNSTVDDPSGAPSLDSSADDDGSAPDARPLARLLAACDAYPDVYDASAQCQEASDVALVDSLCRLSDPALSPFPAASARQPSVSF